MGEINLRNGSEFAARTAAFTSLDLVLDPELNCRSETIRLALEHWRGLCGTRTMPALADLDALHIPRRVLPHVSLLDIEYEPEQRFRWRLIGTAVTNVLRRDMTGRYWDEIYDENVYTAWVRTANSVLRSRAPLRFTARAHVAGKEIYDAEHIYLPMSGGGGRVERIFNVSVFTSSRGPELPSGLLSRNRTS